MKSCRATVTFPLSGRSPAQLMSDCATLVEYLWFSIALYILYHVCFAMCLCPALFHVECRKFRSWQWPCWMCKVQLEAPKTISLSNITPSISTVVMYSTDIKTLPAKRPRTANDGDRELEEAWGHPCLRYLKCVSLKVCTICTYITLIHSLHAKLQEPLVVCHMQEGLRI